MQGLWTGHPVQWNITLIIICFCPCLSNDSGTRDWLTLSTWGYLIRMGRIWTSGAANTSRHGHKCRDPLAPWPRFSWLNDKIRGPMRPRWDHPWLLSLAFSLRRSGAWAIYLSTISIWRKWIEPKLLNVDGFWKDLHLWSYWITI